MRNLARIFCRADGKNDPIALRLQSVGMNLIKIDDHSRNHRDGAVLASPYAENAVGVDVNSRGVGSAVGAGKVNQNSVGSNRGVH